MNSLKLSELFGIEKFTLLGVDTDDSQTYGLEEVDVQGGSFDRRAIAESLSTENEDIDALARQIKPSDYGNVIPYSVGSGTTYSITASVVNTTSGPKLYIGGSQAPDLTYVFPGHELVIDVSDNSNFGYTLAFSETPDGIHNGGTDYVVGLSRTATPGTTGATVTLTVSQTTPQQLYLYATETSRVGLRGGGFLNATDHCKVAIFSKWYLARITQAQIH